MITTRVAAAAVISWAGFWHRKPGRAHGPTPGAASARLFRLRVTCQKPLCPSGIGLDLNRDGPEQQT